MIGLAVLCGGLVAMTPEVLEAAQQPRYAASVDAVRVDVLVTDKGRAVTDLGVGDFELRDEGVLQRVQTVESDTLPLDVIYAVDTSGAELNARLATFVNALETSLDSLQSRDRVGLLSFGSSVRVLSPLVAEHAVVRGLLRWLQPAHVAAFRDAIFTALALRPAGPSRVIMLVFSQGTDHISWLSPARLVDAVRRTDVVVYSVATRFRGVTPFEQGPILKVLAEETGGRVILAAEGRDLRRVFVDVLAECRSRYVLTYVPAGVRPGGWHRLEVTLARKRGRVFARRGYFAE